MSRQVAVHLLIFFLVSSTLFAKNYASTQVQMLVDDLSVPLAGRRFSFNARIVENSFSSGPSMQGSLIGSRGTVNIPHSFLAEISGVKVVSGQQATIDNAVRTIVESPRLRAEFKALMGHEIGHYLHGDVSQGLRGIAPGEFTNNAMKRRDYVVKRLERLFQAGGQLRKTSTGEWVPIDRAEIRAQFDAAGRSYANAGADRKLFLQTLRTSKDFSEAFKKATGGGYHRNTDVQRRLNILHYIKSNPQVAKEVGSTLKSQANIDIGGRLFVIEPGKGTVKVEGPWYGRPQKGLSAWLERSIASLAKGPSINPGCHVAEYTADEHGLLSQYRRSGNLKNALSVFNTQSIGRIPTAYFDTHPSQVARLTNLISYIKIHPEVFADGLQKPLTIEVGGQKLTLVARGGKILVKGRSALFHRVAKSEQVLLREYHKARGLYSVRVEGRGGLRSLETMIAQGARDHRPRHSKASKRLVDQVLKGQPVSARHGSKRSIFKRAAHGLAGTGSTLLTIMVMHAVAQYQAQGSMNLETAVVQTLDSPEVWAGIGLATATSKAANPASARALLSTPGMKGAFLRTLASARASIITLASFQIAGAYIRQAGEGLNGDGTPVTISQLFKDGKVRSGFMGNMTKIMVSPSAHCEILGRVFKEQILTCEFAGTVAGMIGGAKAGALTFGALGSLATPAVGAVAGAVGGLGGAVVGGLVGSSLGRAADRKIANWRFQRVLSETTNVAKLKANKEKLATLRTRLVGHWTKEYVQHLREYIGETGADDKAELKQEIARFENEIDELYLDELEAVCAIVEKTEEPQALRIENELFAEYALLKTQLAQLKSAALNRPIQEDKIVQARESEELAPAFAGLSLTGM